MRRYGAQAIAVVMIILIIAAILGVAIIARGAADSRRIALEKSSAEALEITDSVLTSIKGVKLDLIKTACLDTAYGAGFNSSEGCVAENTNEVNSLLSKLNAGPGISSFEKCATETSNVKLSIRLANENDELELSPDSTRGFPLNGSLPTVNSCSLNLTFEPRGNTSAGVNISRIYASIYDTDGIPLNYKEYATSDMTQYCIYNQGFNCNSNTNMGGTWVPVQSGTTIAVPLAPSGKFRLDEVRVTSIGDTVAMKSSLSNPGCISNWEMVVVKVESTCSGVTRAKEIQFAQTPWALPLFDYTLFNGKGSLGFE